MSKPRSRFAVECGLLISLALVTAPCIAEDETIKLLGAPRSPQESLASIKVAPGFEVELVAAEPLVQDPVAFDWGPDGKLWVVEMGDYPLGIDATGKPGGRVKYLEDTNGDGHYTKATVFLENLPFPTGVRAWRKGVLVTCAPDIFYAEDTTASGKPADKRVTLFTGFAEGNQQHRINSLTYGLDNWLYCANGHSNGKVRSLTNPSAGEVDISSRDLRIRPDEGLIETQTGVTQYGRTRDDWGNAFGNDNSNPMFHFVLDDRYLRRNPHAAAEQVRVHISTVPGAAPVYPRSRTTARFNDPEAANHFTSACAAIVYRDELFGPYSNSTFVCECVHNLIHREVIEPKGVTFSSHRADDERQSEFFASSDGWTRPVWLATGPDGALWVCDMYRAVIEHPQWIPKEWQQRLDLRAGHELGRIYRVYPKGHKPRPIPRLDKLDTAGLVATLASPNGWQRDMAQQLLVHGADRAAIPLLQRQVAESASPLCRLHSLCTLDGQGALDESILQRALADKHPGVRRQAVRLCEALLPKSAVLGVAVAAMIDDADAPVRLQVACTLGCWDDPAAGAALARLLARDPEDPFVRAAVMSSLTARNIEALAAQLLAPPRKAALPPALLEPLVRSAKAMGGPALTLRLMAQVAAPQADSSFVPPQFAAMAAMLDALEQAGMSLDALSKDAPANAAPQVGAITALLAAARRAVTNEQTAQADRLAALPLLGREADKRAEDLKTLAGLLSPQSPQETQAAAIDALARRRTPQTPALLLAKWKTLSPALRNRVLDALLNRADWGDALLNAIEKRTVRVVEIDAPRRARLLQHKSDAIRQRAQKLLAGATSDRADVLAAYKDAMTVPGKAEHGRELFLKLCATCHKMGDAGVEVGPDLAAIGTKTPEYLYISIVDPNAAVDPRFTNYLLETRAGDSFSGVLLAETGTSITLALSGGERRTFLRTDVRSFRSTGLSLMPEGLEQGLAPQDIADIIAAVRAIQPPRVRKNVAGNEPKPVHPDENGVIHLIPTEAEIYGKTLTLEPRYGNLGLWRSADDEASWAVEVPATAGGKYLVTMLYACDTACAGNGYVLQCGNGAELAGTIAGTRSWDTYSRVRLGEVTLAPGRLQISLKATGELKGALMDLKTIVLTPVPAGK